MISAVSFQHVSRHFGSVAKLKGASVEELAAVKGMTRLAADEVYRYFHG